MMNNTMTDLVYHMIDITATGHSELAALNEGVGPRTIPRRHIIIHALITKHRSPPESKWLADLRL